MASVAAMISRVGICFGVTAKLKQIPTLEIIAATEATASQLNTDTAQLLRHKMSSILSTAKPPKSNLSKELHKSVKSLREDHNIVILPADKGNATVVLDRTDYVNKMESLLEDNAYKKVKRNPTSKVETKISTALKECENKGYITSKKRLSLAHQFSAPPQIYGLPKIHKEGIPLRPIVAAIGSPTHRLAKELARILSPLAGKSPSHVRNSADFTNQIHHISFQETDIMASFDVVSLFTKIPVDEALHVISQRLQQDDTLKDRTSIPIPDLCALVELCLKSTYFQFGESFYEQVEGAAMGSPLSPIVANVFMENFETRALDTSSKKPKMWHRYVDDVFVIWPHGDQLLEEFHQHLNRQNPSIQFTVEREAEGKIAFLDVQLKREGTKIHTSVFRKRTHTDRYLNFDSNHPAKTKRGIIQCLKNRAEKVCDDSTRWQEINHLQRVFKANGYPNAVVKRNLRPRPRPTSTTEPPTDETPPKLFLPYISGISERIDRICRPLGIKTVYKSNNTLRSALVNVKQPREDKKKKGVVYEVPCRDCDSVYIGETSRTLEKRLSEHKNAVKKHDTNNGIAVHAWNLQHQVDWDAAKTRATEEHYWKRRVLEALHIHQQQQSSNLDCGLAINPSWLPLLDKPTDSRQR